MITREEIKTILEESNVHSYTCIEINRLLKNLEEENKILKERIKNTCAKIADSRYLVGVSNSKSLYANFLMSLLKELGGKK